MNYMGMDYFFCKALYDLAIEQGSPNVIISLRDKALEQIVNGDGSQLISATLNSKTISKKVYRDPAQLLAEKRPTHYKFIRRVLRDRSE